MAEALGLKTVEISKNGKSPFVDSLPPGPSPGLSAQQMPGGLSGVSKPEDVAWGSQTQARTWHSAAGP